MTRQQQRITITHRDGARFEFAGNNYRLITAAMGLRVVVDEGGTCVWTEPSVQAGGPAEVKHRKFATRLLFESHPRTGRRHGHPDYSAATDGRPASMTAL